jgi:hypothetical protein
MGRQRSGSNEQRKLRKLLTKLLNSECTEFPPAHERLDAPNRKGVYIIYSPQGKILHVGSTPYAKGGLAQRLRLAGKSSFTKKKFNRDGSKLRAGCSFRCLVVKNDRQRALLEALGIGELCPEHIGHGRDRSLEQSKQS